MIAKKKIPARFVKSIDVALEAIIDQWYLSVSDYYITAEKKAEDSSIAIPEELKRFHDETGHRIKFNKGDLDFTFGLSVSQDSDSCILEASINNKVPHFNYGELARRLSIHYNQARGKTAENIKTGKKVSNSEVFRLPEDLQHSLSVEQREGRADIVRLGFEVLGEHLEELVSDPPNFMEFIHHYCVAPLRRTYADVFRIKSR